MTTPNNTECKPDDPILAFDDFLNLPPDYENQTMVREYRHAAYKKWKPVLQEIERQAARIEALEAERVEIVKAALDMCAEFAKDATQYTQFQTVEHYKISTFIEGAIRAIDPQDVLKGMK